VPGGYDRSGGGPGVGVEGEALDEGTPAARPAGERRRFAARHLDTFQLEDAERSIGRRLLREDTSRVKQVEDTVTELSPCTLDACPLESS
jgi:hypothetical protein